MILKPPKGVLLDRSHPFARGISFYFLLNELSGSKVYDAVTRQSGSFSGTIDWVPDGLNFAGVSDYINCGTNSLWDVGASDFTLMVDVEPDQLDHTTYAAIIAMRDAGATMSWELYYQNFGTQLYFGVRDAGGLDATIFDAIDYELTVGLRETLVVTRSGGTFKLYADGVLLGTDTSARSGALLADESLYIGCLGADETDEEWKGKIYKAALWKQRFSDANVSRLYQNPFCMFEQPVTPFWVAATSVGAPVGVAPTAALYGPLVGSLGGPI